MNYLAHGLLGGEHPDLLTGSFTGDFFKGPLPGSINPAIRLGVKLHRHIDAVSNQLPGIRISVRRFPASLRRFAPIFLDILGDHFLAKNFTCYWRGDLTEFTDTLYPVLKSRSDQLPEPAVAFIDHAIDSRLLHRYADFTNIPRVFLSIETRFKHPQPGLAEAAFESCRQNYEALEMDFSDYFPELQVSAGEFARLNPAQ